MRKLKPEPGPADKRIKALMAAVALAAAFVLGACAGVSGPAPVRSARPEAPLEPPRPLWVERPEFVRPPHMEGLEPVRLGLLLPLSAPAEEVQAIARALRDSAEFAVFQVGRPDILVLSKDTGGTPEGARLAAEAALREGAEILLGPLFGSEVAVVAPLAGAAGVPVVAFSSDMGVAQPGVFLLSFPPEEEVARIASFAVEKGLRRFAALVPASPYGDRARAALSQSTASLGVELTNVVSYDPAGSDFLAPARTLADSHHGGSPFDAVLIPEGGTTVRGIAPLLPYYDVDNRIVKFLGTGLWDDPSIWREPTLIGGWFAATDPEVRGAFDARFAGVYGYKPPRIATLAFDAVTLAATLAPDGPPGLRFAPEHIADANGFGGIDGIFRFRPDGRIERGLAVLEIVPGGVKVIAPSPARFTIPASALGS